MTDAEKINAIKQLLKKYGFRFEKMTLSQVVEGFCYVSLYDIADEMINFLEFGNELIEIVNKE